MLKRLFDVMFSIMALISLLPFLLLIFLLVKLESKGPAIFIQSRVGRNNIDFNIYKFRTMRLQPHNTSRLTISHKDSRITKIGYYLRRYKIDEFPQLINVIKGDMSLVGPRPELRYYVNFYNETDMLIFKVRPGITGLASLKYHNEVELLKAAKKPEEYYIRNILTEKIRYNKLYIKQRYFFYDIKLIILTVMKVFSK